jgi:D-alanyl-D-alanine carboxypeptidase
MQIYNFFGIFVADMMKKTLITVFFTALTLSICGQSDWKSQTIGILDSLCADPLFETSQLGLAVWDLTDDSLIYAVGYRQRLRPASCQKVITAVTALKSLGAEHRYSPYVREAGWGWCWDDKITNPDVDGEPLLNDTAVWTLNDVLQPMLKESDNLMAESVFLQLAGKSGRSGAGRKEAVAEVERLMADLALNPKDYLIADGSGLSLYDYVTVELLVRVLRYAWQWDNIRIPFIEALPIAGIDGTLEKRMIRTSAHGNVRAKTGTVEGVSSLAGYCRTSEGHFLCYAIINQGIVRARTGRDFQDSICVALTRK